MRRPNIRLICFKRARARRAISIGAFASIVLLLALAAFGQIPGRPNPAGGSVPNPGTQQQELTNITLPAPYNVFEFPVTCAGCHGGAIDQTAGHFSNWAGTSMASAARDPVFRANSILLNSQIKNRPLGADGAANACWRCHSPNGWLSGRFDPKLGGTADGTDFIASMLLSTDGEGVMCETCHRSLGGVTMNRITPPVTVPGNTDLGANLADPVWKLMAGPIGEWPHGSLNPYPAGDGNRYGDGTIQYADAMSYGATYGGNMELAFSDRPLLGLPYTGQIYGVLQWWITNPFLPPPPVGLPTTNDVGDVIVYNPDGTLVAQFEAGVTPDPVWGAISPEHSTRVDDFVRSAEFCGSCHEENTPILNHGTAVQRTYTEWKYSAYGQGTSGLPDARCQGCHMSRMKHEFADTAPVSLNPDPLMAGWYPYAKDRNGSGGTSFHKLSGGNRDLPMMMKVLYPEVDLEVVGAPTGNDPRIFPGMLSGRDPMFDRAQRNTEIGLRDAVKAEITSGPTETAAGVYQVKVKVTNNTGHKLPSGYADGRRMWISLTVRNSLGNPVYQSGYYDPTTAKLYTDQTLSPLVRAMTPAISDAANAVMVYEKLTGTANADGTTYSVSSSPTNEKIVFDNRIPPLGFTNADYSANGAGFWTFTGTESAAIPVEQVAPTTRYPDGQNWDEVTYTFAAPAGSTLSARAEVQYQSHSREYMDYLVGATNALAPADQGPRPEGPPNPLDPNYPLTPTFLSDSISVTTGEVFSTMTDLAGSPLQDNWAGVAYASWLLTGKGAPFVMATADTSVLLPPGQPATVTIVTPTDPATGLLDPNTQVIQWSLVTGADGYLVRVRYGASALTSDWDELAVVFAPETQLIHTALNVAKTFAYTVQAFNAAGYGTESLAAVGSTPLDLPLPPFNTRVLGVTNTTVSLTWSDQSDNEIGFIVERQDVPLDRTQPLPAFAEVARFTSPNAAPPPGYLNLSGFGGVNFTDGAAAWPICSSPPPVDPYVANGGTTYPIPANGPAPGCYTTAWVPLQPGRTYNYRISAYNATGGSGPDLPVGATTTGRPLAPSALTATILAVPPSSYQVNLAWSDNSGNETGFRVERSINNVTFTTLATLGANVIVQSDSTVVPNTTYWYRVYAFNAIGDSVQPSNTVRVVIPNTPPNAPSLLAAIASAPSPNPPTVALTWTDNSNNETNFLLDRATDAGFTQGFTTFTLGANVTSYTDTTVAPKTGYYYRVFARNAAGTSGPNPSTGGVFVLTPGEIPQAPSNLTVGKTTQNSISLSWTDNSINEQGFYIERSPNGTTGWTLVGTVSANVTTFTNTGLTRKTTYFYRVQAFNADGVSAYTDPPVSAKTK